MRHMTKAPLSSWGKYPPYPQTPHYPQWQDELPQKLKHVSDQYQHSLPFGNGRSYGDSCLAASNHVISMRPLNRFIDVDWHKGIIKAEAGITLEEILDIAIPQGWFLPVTPGTKYVTLGGALANDVHGKNHHKRGTFGCHVQEFCLFRSDRKSLICSAKENIDLFHATIGGLGLTGIIQWVELKLLPISSSLIDITNIRFNSFAEFLSLANELDKENEYSVAWVDCLAKGKNLGRGIYTIGNHLTNGKLEVSHKKKFTMPFTPPISLVNKLTLKPFNFLYYNIHPPRQNKKVTYDKFFYPLDSILEWNRIYGKKGFQQYQCIIPKQHAEDALKELLGTIARAGVGSFLAVLKRCGNIKSPGLLSFPMEGISLALDFVQNDKVNQELFTQLDKITHQANGRLYPAKDAHMSAEDFQSAYPQWKKLESLRDPALYSHFWKRVTS
jgi:FAD/FMN-containing dehydrogenase